MNTAVKASGFTYNAEQYDTATGMLNLRARQYEPAMNRFSQKDKLRGSASTPLSLNRYGYVQNDPVNLIDPSGMRHVDMQVNGEYYSEEEFHQKVDNLRSAAKERQLGTAVTKYKSGDSAWRDLPERMCPQAQCRRAFKLLLQFCGR